MTAQIACLHVTENGEDRLQKRLAQGGIVTVLPP